MADTSRKAGRNKKYCEHYKAVGRRETNKKLKAVRNEKRIEHFKKRREAGKNYEWKPNPYSRADKEERSLYYMEEFERAQKRNRPHKDPVSQFRSIMAKLQNELDAKEAAFRQAKESIKKGVKA